MRKLAPPFRGPLCLPAAIFFVAVLGSASTFFGQAPVRPGRAASGSRIGRPSQGQPGVSRTTADIMAVAGGTKERSHLYLKRELEIPGRRNRPQDPSAIPASRFPNDSTARLATATTNA